MAMTACILACILRCCFAQVSVETQAKVNPAGKAGLSAAGGMGIRVKNAADRRNCEIDYFDGTDNQKFYV
jgi:hypothetical protein